MEGKAVKVMDAAVKPQALNQLLLILNAAHHVAVLWPWVKEEKSAISCCLSVGTSKLIIEMQNFFLQAQSLVGLLPVLCLGRATGWTLWMKLDT